MNQIGPTGQQTTLVHFVYGGDTTGDWRIACMPNMTEFHATEHHPNYLRTNDPRGVSCPACKKTPACRGHVDVLNAAAKRVLGGR